MEASFFKRLFAYLIDLLFISLLVSVVTYSFNYNKAEALDNEILKISNSYVSGKITIDEYISEYKDYIYDYQNYSKVKNGISLVLYIGYFIVFQYLNKGQTLGKKLMKIKVVNKEKNNVKLTSIIIRSLFITEMIPLFFGVLLLFLVNKGTYAMAYLYISGIVELFIIISSLFVIYRQDHLGIHDMIAKTKVINAK